MLMQNFGEINKEYYAFMVFLILANNQNSEIPDINLKNWSNNKSPSPTEVVLVQLFCFKK